MVQLPFLPPQTCHNDLPLSPLKVQIVSAGAPSAGTAGDAEGNGVFCAMASASPRNRFVLDVNYLGRYASTTLAAFELFLS